MVHVLKQGSFFLINGYENNALYFFNFNNNLNKYNEYVWGDGTGESTIKTIIDTWYEISGLSNYENKIANVPYCSDKSNLNTINSFLIYGFIVRFMDLTTELIKTNVTPTYRCERAIDRNTVSGDRWGGNGELSKSIGILTADEVVFAGGFICNESYCNTSNYLYSSYPY